MSDATYKPQPGEEWQYINGNKYTVIGLSNTDHPHERHPPDVVYQGDNGSLWTMPLSDWHAKFTLVRTNKPDTTYIQQAIRAIRAYREACRLEYGHDGFGIAEHVVSLFMMNAKLLDTRGQAERNSGFVVNGLDDMQLAQMIVNSGRGRALLEEMFKALGCEARIDPQVKTRIRLMPLRASGAMANSVQFDKPKVADVIAALQRLPWHYAVEFSPGECVDVTSRAALEVLEGDTGDGPGTAWLKLID